VANSKLLKGSLEKMQVAAAKTAETGTQKLPQLNLSSNYTRVSDDVTPLTLKFPNSPSPIVLNPQVLNQFSENIGGSALIYAGGRIKKSILSLSFLERASRSDYENDKAGVVFNIISAIYGLYSLQQSAKILDANEDLLKARLNDLQNLASTGIALPNDVMKLAISLSQLNTQLVSVKDSYESTRYGLAILLGLPDSCRIILDTTQFFTYTLDKPYAYYENTALSSRPDLGSAADRLTASMYMIDATKANYYPTLSASASYNYLKPNQRWLPQRNKFDPAWSAGITLAWNLSSLLANKSYVAEAKANYIQNFHLKASIADNIKTELYSNYLAYQQAVDQLKLAQLTLDQSVENYRLIYDRLQDKIVLAADLQEALTYLVQSQLTVLVDKANIDLAYFKFIKSTGKLNQ
jgi:outer membrane protein TolC